MKKNTEGKNGCMASTLKSEDDEREMRVAGFLAVALAASLPLVPHGFHAQPAVLGPGFGRAAPRSYRRPTPLGMAMAAPLAAKEDGANGVDAAYPYLFDGRLWFRPAIVRVPPELPGDVRPVGLFGFSIGGVVCLEYDVSPVGPYFEYVTMGALVTKRGALGQWGSRLFVSTEPAEEVCQRVWGVPAEVASLDFADPGEALQVVRAPPREASQDAPPPAISVAGWSKTRSADAGAALRGGLPILWTPTIKALWAPLIPLPRVPGAEEAALPLHKLRLSAKSLRLQW